MTEAEWFAADGKAVDRLVGRHSPRLQRLVAVAVCRVLCEPLDYPSIAPALEAAETFADTGKTKAALRRARQAVRRERDALFNSNRPFVMNNGGIEQALFTIQVAASENAAWGTVSHAIESLIYLNGVPDEESRRRLFPVFDDVIGNLYRRAAVDRRWRTSTAVALASRMYESRDFSPMPILADALQDAGCESDDVLNHCRDPNGTHVRGCWVVDGVLGKS